LQKDQISPTVKDYHSKNTRGDPLAGGQLFCKYLLNTCHESFERSWVANGATVYDSPKAKRQYIGLVKLFKMTMLTERIMHECIKKLLRNSENSEEEMIESLCVSFRMQFMLQDVTNFVAATTTLHENFAKEKSSPYKDSYSLSRGCQSCRYILLLQPVHSERSTKQRP